VIPTDHKVHNPHHNPNPKSRMILPISIFPAYDLPKFSARKEFIIELLCQIKEDFGLGTTCTVKRIYIEKT